MRKRIRKIGTSLGCYFDKDDKRVYGVKVGSVIEISYVDGKPTTELLKKNKSVK